MDQEKLKVAKENGADEIVSPKDGDPTKRVMEITENLGADAIIDFVNASKTVETDMKMLRRRGRAGPSWSVWWRTETELGEYANSSLQINRIVYWEFK